MRALTPPIIRALLGSALESLTGGGASGGGLGTELLTNGDFGAGSAGWALSGEDGTHILTFSGGTMRYQSDTITPVLTLLQSPAIVVGRQYRITAVCSARTSGGVSVGMTGGGTIAVNGAGTVSAIVTATATAFTISRNGTNVDLTLDSVSLRPVLA